MQEQVARMSEAGIDLAVASSETRQRTEDPAAAEPYAKPIPDILSQIRDSYAELRRAERRVADVVLADVTFCVDASNAEIARRADV
ncbi:MAG: hypothetical protein JNL61_00815, partial [Rhizobiaceae bacterium]|nr:hypothetical protein [Rhizobiaceae bacterium]